MPGTAAPFIVGADGPDRCSSPPLDNLIAQSTACRRMIAISIANGGGDAQGSERGLEYDTMSGRYAEFVETEVLPRVEARAHVTAHPRPRRPRHHGRQLRRRGALIMAWYHPDLYHRVLTYSGTFVNQQWPYNPETPDGAWEFHEHLIPKSPRKPIRIWMEVGDRDLLNPNSCATACTTGCWPTSAWPACWPPSTITINLSLLKTPATSTAPSACRPCLKRWSTSGRGIEEPHQLEMQRFHSLYTVTYTSRPTRGAWIETYRL